MSIGNLNVTITLNNGQFTAALTQSGVALQQFNGQVRVANANIANTSTALSRFGTRLRDTVVTLGLARNAVLNVWTVFGALPAQMVRVTAEFERMNILLANMSEGANFAQKLEGGKVQFQQIIDLARKAPFSITAIQDAWVKFKSAGLDPANGSLQSLLDAVAAFGGTDDILKRASIAIQQMAGKGVISMEELRQQLGEAVPTAMKNLADSFGISVSELAKRISKGGVQAQESLKALFIEFQRLYGGQAENLMQSFSGQLSLLTTDMKLFANEVVTNSGLFATLKDVMVQVREAFANPAFKQAITEFVAGLASGIRTLVTFTQWVAENGKEIARWVVILGSALIGIRLVAPALMAVGTAGLAAGKMLRDFVIWMQIIVGIFVTSGLRAAIANVRILLAGLFAISPAGWVAITVGALAAVGAWLGTVARRADEATEKLKVFWDSASAKEIDDAQNGLKQYQKDLNAILNALREGGKFVAGAGPGVATFVKFSDQEKKALEKRRDELVQTIISTQADIDRAKRSLAQREGDAESRKYQFDVKQIVDRIRAKGLAEQVAERDRLQEAESDDKIRAKKYAEFTIASMDRTQKEINTYLEGQIEKQRTLLAKVNDTRIRSIITQNIDALQALKQGTTELTQGAIDSRTAGIPDMFAGDDKNAKDPLGKFVNGIERRIARLRALIDGEKEMPQELADFQERLTNLGGATAFDGVPYTPEKLTAAQEQVRLMASLNDQVQKQNNLNTQSKYAMDGMATLLASVSAEQQKWDRVLRSGGIDETNTALESVNKQLEKFRENIQPRDQEAFDAMAKRVSDMARDNAANAKISELMLLIEQDRDKLLIRSADARAREVERFKQLLDLYVKQNLLTDEQAAKIRKLADEWANQKTQIQALESPLGQLAKEWADVTANMKKSTAEWVSSGVDAFIEFAMTGKNTFKDFAKQILKDIAKIILRAIIAQAILSAIGVTPGQTASTGNAFKDILANMVGANIGAKSANGNVMTEWGPAPLKRWGEGGIARRPMVSVFGEGAKPEAYVPLPDGRTIPVTVQGGMSGGNAPPVTVNVINQTGQQATAEQRGPARFDGNSFVLDIVMKAVNQPGQFRDSMRNAVR